MRSLKNVNTQARNTVRPSMGQQSTGTNAFKKGIQLLDRVILKKLDEKPISSGNLLANLFDEEYALIESLTPHWQRREVSRAIRSVRQEVGRQEGSTNQYLLPGFEDFPQRIRIGAHQPRLAAI